MTTSDTTELLIRLKKGEENIYNKLYPLIYGELKKIAYANLHIQSPDHTLSETELVHETYLKMIDQSQIDFNDKSHFLAIASRCMRQILIDYARKKHAQKRGGNKRDITFIDELFHSSDYKTTELINIDLALDKLEKLNERLAEVVEMRFFGKMTIRQTANALNISESTVKRDWKKARGWLYKELNERF